jgi:phosphoglucosamine mutase
MAKLFGTDGIRGEAGRFPLTPADVYVIGRAAGRVLKQKYPKTQVRVLVVRDTRGSGPGLLKNLSDGLRTEGIDVYDGGVLCTPSVALLVRTHKFHSGVVISASHNPPSSNGIKFFSAQARKWPDEWEEAVESLVASGKISRRPGKPTGRYVKAEALMEDYEEFLVESLSDQADLSGLKIAVDCSHGANHHTAPAVLKRLGATVYAIGVEPNGKNINVNCGSQHTEKLSKLVRSKRCHAGVAFDGDGDRVIFVDEKGTELDGDYIIALLAREFKRNGVLRHHKAVITVMANVGLRKALSKIGVKMVTTPVGDRYVSQAMKKHRAVLGGEQSGHIILGRYLPTGDGLLTALHTLALLKRNRRPLSQLAGWMKKFPQVLLNLPVKERRPLETLDGVNAQIKSVEKTLGSNGRVLVRYSGTEPLLRIMLEGPDKTQLRRYATGIADLVKKAQ